MSKFLSITCGWPNHGDPDCARCAVMYACLAQVPGDNRGEFMRQARIQDWMADNQYASENDWDRWFDRDYTIDDVWHELAAQVADRLIEWVQWLGRRQKHDIDNLAHACRQCGRHERDAQSLRTELCSADIHPLHGTLADQLRPAFDEQGTNWTALALITDWLSQHGQWKQLIHEKDWKP